MTYLGATMNNPHLLKNARHIKALAERLSHCPDVAKFNAGDDIEGWTLAHSFADIEESCSKFLNDQLPKLAQSELSDSELYELLLDIGEGLRHILYHVKDTKFYQYLQDD